MKLTTVLCAILTLFSIQLENNDKNSVVPEKNKHTLNYVRQKSFSAKKIQSTNIHYTKINEIVNNLMGNKEIKKMNADLEIEKCFKDAGIDENEFIAKVDMLADRAFEDQCTTANPRVPLVSELKQILIDSYYGN